MTNCGSQNRIKGWRLLLALAGIAAIITRPSAKAQKPAQFEVVSIKPNASDDHRVALQIAPGGAFKATGATVKILIQQAYGIKDFQISGGPGWLSTERYDVDAKTPGAVAEMPQEKMKLMLQAMLEDRFRLKTHHESKEMQGYSLVVAKGGPRLQEAANTADGGKGGMMRMSRGSLTAQGIKIDSLVNMLGNQLSRTVVNNTGLNGNYDVKLEWTPDPNQGGGMLGEREAGAPAAEGTGPTLFTALQEQLGLRLEAQKVTVDILVVDSAEKASDN